MNKKGSKGDTQTQKPRSKGPKMVKRAKEPQTGQDHEVKAKTTVPETPGPRPKS